MQLLIICLRFTNFTTIACSVQICNFTPLANSMYSMPNDYITRVNIETRPKGTKVIYLQRLSDLKKSIHNFCQIYNCESNLSNQLKPLIINPFL